MSAGNNHTPPDSIPWLEWGTDAFDRARQKDMPVFLYLTVPWSHTVHVFRKDVLGDPDVITQVKSRFVPVRVNALRMPDVFERYNQGGWPSICLLTPEGDLLHGRTTSTATSLRDTLRQVADYWDKHYEVIRKRAREVGPPELPRLIPPGPEELTDPAPLEGIRHDAMAHYDLKYGGFGRAPKLPMADLLLFLLTDPEDEYKQLALATLETLRMSPLHDVIGGGFHRYAELETWGQPRFEKLLYGNASLLEAYTEAYRITGEPRYENVAEGILAFLEGPLGGESPWFYAAQDSETEPGEAGDYYGWSREEMVEALDNDELLCTAALTYFGISPHSALAGDPERSYLEERVGPAQLSMRLIRDEGAVQELLVSARKKLRAARDAREAPDLDTTVYSGDQGRVLSALATAGIVFNRPQSLQRALALADALWADGRRTGGGVEHVIGETGETIYLQDQAEVMLGLLELYRVAGRGQDLVRAVTLARETLDLLGDPDGTGCFDHLAREKEEGAAARAFTPFEPNARLLNALIQIAAYTGGETWHRRALDLSSALAQARLRHRLRDASYGRALRILVRPPQMVDLIGTESGSLRRRLVIEAPPGTLLRGFDPDQPSPWTPADKYASEGEHEAAAVVYSQGTKSDALTSADQILQQLYSE